MAATGQGDAVKVGTAAAADADLALGQHRELWHDYERAIRPYRRAWKAYGDRPDICFHLGSCYERLGDDERSVSFFRRAVAQAGCPAAWHYSLGAALLRQGRIQDADASFRKAWSTEPNGALAIDLGSAKWASGVSMLLDPASAADLDAAVSRPDPARDGAVRDLVRDLATRTDLSSVAWLYLYALLLASGYVSAALAAKRFAARKIVEQATERPPASQRDIQTALAAACFVESYDLAGNILDRCMGEGVLAPDVATRLQLDLLMAQGRVEPARRLLAASELGGHVHSVMFRAAVQRQSCAVVGPAVNDLGNGREIDAHDTVLRTNVVSPELIAEHADMIGGRTDVSYYSTEYFSLRQGQILEYLKESGLKCAVFRHYITRKIAERKIPGLRTRRWLSFKKHDFVGIGFAMRHILFDILLFADRPVSVYGADFYMGRRTHYRGYFDEGIDVFREYARHDVFDTFNFMRRMHEIGAIRCDAILAGVLDQSPEAFAGRAAAVHSAPPGA